MPADSGSVSPRARQHARRLALQALYQWDVSGGEAKALLGQFVDDEERADADYLARLIEGVLSHASELHKQLIPALDRDLSRLDPVERTALRFGCYELLYCPEVPVAVVLAEATRLASKFGSENSSRYVNAVLDQVAHALPNTR